MNKKTQVILAGILTLVAVGLIIFAIYYLISNKDVNKVTTKLESTTSKAKIATDYGNTAIEKGTPLANTKDKRKSFWRKLSGSWNQAAKREAGNKAIEAGNDLLNQVETVKNSEKEITKKNKKYNQ